MLKLQSLILNLFALLFLAAAVLLGVQNLSIEIFIQWPAKTSVSLGGLLLINGIFVALAIGCRIWSHLLVLGHKQKKTSRELERKDVSHEAAESRVKVLENKVQTLEKALSEALKK